MSENGGQPSTRTQAPERASDAEGDAQGRWALVPETVIVHRDVDLGADDPAAGAFDGRGREDWRRCVATRRDGHRCGARALDDALICPIHDGRADPVLAARASHERREAALERAAQAHALQKLGTRAVVAQALAEEATNIKAAIKLLAASAGNGDLKSAQALIPWLDQALGKPTERHEHTTPTTVKDVQSLSQSELEAMVAEGRARRLRLVEERSETA